MIHKLPIEIALDEYQMAQIQKLSEKFFPDKPIVMRIPEFRFPSEPALVPIEFEIEQNKVKGQFTVKKTPDGKWGIIAGPKGFLNIDNKWDYYSDLTLKFEDPKQALEYWEFLSMDLEQKDPWDQVLYFACSMVAKLRNPPTIKRAENGDLLVGDYVVKREQDLSFTVTLGDHMILEKKSFGEVMKKIVLDIVSDYLDLNEPIPNHIMYPW